MKKWVKSRNGQQTIVILSFMIIPLLLLFVFTYLPFGEMVKFSFYKMKYATPVDKRQFVGFRNYIDVFKKDECFSALKLSLYYMAGAMVQLVLALYLAPSSSAASYISESTDMMAPMKSTMLLP